MQFSKYFFIYILLSLFWIWRGRVVFLPLAASSFKELTVPTESKSRRLDDWRVAHCGCRMAATRASPQFYAYTGNTYKHMTRCVCVCVEAKSKCSDDSKQQFYSQPHIQTHIEIFSHAIRCWAPAGMPKAWLFTAPTPTTRAESSRHPFYSCAAFCCCRYCRSLWPKQMRKLLISDAQWCVERWLHANILIIWFLW